MIKLFGFLFLVLFDFSQSVYSVPIEPIQNNIQKITDPRITAGSLIEGNNRLYFQGIKIKYDLKTSNHVLEMENDVFISAKESNKVLEAICKSYGFNKAESIEYRFFGSIGGVFLIVGFQNEKLDLDYQSDETLLNKFGSTALYRITTLLCSK